MAALRQTGLLRRMPSLIAVCVAQLWSSPVVAILFVAWALSEVRQTATAAHALRADDHPNTSVFAVIVEFSLPTAVSSRLFQNPSL